MLHPGWVEVVVGHLYLVLKCVLYFLGGDTFMVNVSERSTCSHKATAECHEDMFHVQSQGWQTYARHAYMAHEEKQWVTACTAAFPQNILPHL